MDDILTADMLPRYARALDWPARKAHAMQHVKRPYPGVPRRILITYPENRNFLTSLEQGFQTDSRYHLRVRGAVDLHSADLDWADVIITEWCSKLAIALSHDIPPGKTHIIRLHSYEAFHTYPITLHWGGVHGVVFVAEHIRRHVVDTLGLGDLPWLRTATIPIGHDVAAFDRPKSTAARYTLGLNHYQLPNKNAGLAVDILNLLRDHDARWTLSLLGYGSDDGTLLQYDRIRITTAPTNMPEWFFDIGWILSTSHREGTHETVAEGMSSGAVPVVRKWPALPGGAEMRYPNALLFDDAESAARMIRNNQHRWDELSSAAKSESAARFTSSKEHAAWVRFLIG